MKINSTLAILVSIILFSCKSTELKHYFKKDNDSAYTKYEYHKYNQDSIIRFFNDSVTKDLKTDSILHQIRSVKSVEITLDSTKDHTGANLQLKETLKRFVTKNKFSDLIIANTHIGEDGNQKLITVPVQMDIKTAMKKDKIKRILFSIQSPNEYTYVTVDGDFILDDLVHIMSILKDGKNL